MYNTRSGLYSMNLAPPMLIIASRYLITTENKNKLLGPRPVAAKIPSGCNFGRTYPQRVVIQSFCPRERMHMGDRTLESQFATDRRIVGSLRAEFGALCGAIPIAERHHLGTHPWHREFETSSPKNRGFHSFARNLGSSSAARKKFAAFQCPLMNIASDM